MRHRPPHFQHVFSGDGYAAGYYSYLWSEVLDADAFAPSRRPATFSIRRPPKRLRDHVYAAGGSRDPAELYGRFAGGCRAQMAAQAARAIGCPIQ